MAICKFCGKEITWLKEGRKNVPIESDGSIHNCQEKQNAMKSIKHIERDALSAEEIKRYENAINQKK